MLCHIIYIDFCHEPLRKGILRAQNFAKFVILLPSFRSCWTTAVSGCFKDDLYTKCWLSMYQAYQGCYILNPSTQSRSFDVDVGPP